MLRFLLAAVMLALLASPSIAQTLPPGTWIAETNVNQTAIVTPDGTAYGTYRVGHSFPNPWIIRNVFTSAGVPAGLLVGIGSAGSGIQACTADGDTYRMDSVFGWSAHLNIFDSAGRSADGDQFVSIGTMMDPSGTVYAITERGDLYAYESGAWIFVDNLFGSLPVQSEERSWGSIKAERR
jgi:opacity protein-like surface antigen